jgi:hypothetical protein
VQLTKFLIDVNDDVSIDSYILSDTRSADNFYPFNNNWSSCKSMPNRRSICMASNECISLYNRDIYFGLKIII